EGIRVTGGKLESLPRREFARDRNVRLDAQHEPQLRGFSLYRFNQRAAPAAEADDGGVDHCGSIPASLTSLLHLAISCLMNSANSSGAIGAGSSPRPARRA